ncbi:MAG: hypothetical protein GY798_28815 [Hyphomicrobiales bacterium]|nr:hypothetical protein [Hyphomicrobiales bacterium]
MNVWIHSTIAAMSLTAMVAVAAAGVSVYETAPEPAASKSDLLPLESRPQATPAHDYVTVEVRSQGRSILSRIAVPETVTN